MKNVILKHGINIGLFKRFTTCIRDDFLLNLFRPQNSPGCVVVSRNNGPSQGLPYCLKLVKRSIWETTDGF